jgi:hypothetical protein
MSNPSNEPSRFVTCPCQHCDGHIEFDASHAGESVTCPHCGQETNLFVPQQQQQSQQLAPPPAMPRSPRVTKTPKSVGEIVSLICLIAFFTWTALCGLGVLLGFFAVAQGEQANPVITGNDQIARTAGTVGFLIGLGFWFMIWLFGAVPTFMIWMMTRKR